MKKGVVRISQEAFREAFQIKSGMILDAKVDHFGDSSIEIVMIHPSFPDMPEGSIPPVRVLEILKGEGK